MAKRTDQAPIDAIRLLLKEHSIKLQPVVHQITALPTEADLEFYFVPQQFSRFYEPYYRPGQPYKNLKLLNFGRPAISLIFYFKHKYTIERNVDPQVALQHLRSHRDELLNRSLLGYLSPAQQAELKRTDEQLRQIRDDPEAYQFCFSNYYHYYKYWYCSFRYFEDEHHTQTGTGVEHLLKHTERIPGQVHQRLNIIFVDPYYITQPVPRDHKRIDRELETYSAHYKQGTTTLFVRKKE